MNDRNDPAHCANCGEPREGARSACGWCDKCIATACANCGKPKEQDWNWFCNRCTAAKERAYQECREAGVVRFEEVVLARDRALAAARAEDQRIEGGPGQGALHDEGL